MSKAEPRLEQEMVVQKSAPTSNLSRPKFPYHKKLFFTNKFSFLFALFTCNWYCNVILRNLLCKTARFYLLFLPKIVHLRQKAV